MFWIFGWKFFPLLFITGCNVFFQVLLLDTFYSGPYAFSLCFGENFACLWPFCPIFHSIFCYEFSLWVQLGCSSIKVHGGIFHNQLFWNSALDLFSQFSITGCRVLFHQVLVLKHFFTVGPKLFPLCWENLHVCGHFWPYFHSVFAIDFLPGLSLVLWLPLALHSADIVGLLCHFVLISFSISGVTWFWVI